MIDSQFRDALPDRLCIARIAQRKAPNSNIDSSFGSSIAQAIEPESIRFRLPYFDHRTLYHMGYNGAVEGVLQLQGLHS
jgi:hypothetical protein